MEKREYRRFECSHNFWAETYLSEKVKIKNKIKNISMGGICLETSQHMTHNNIYIIDLYSGSNGKIMPAVMVVWSALKKTVKENQNVLPFYEVGLKFVDLSLIERLQLNNLISELSH